ncbi:MAG: molecular chaperone HtpG [Verrucomicrobiales bacterium]|nr:molecular chaperone HtpG [Verrucomicrobiales bacterium]
MSENTHTHAFQAEVRQLLDIVIHSLYTDKEIFVRELVSNASDALEKLRHLQLTEKEIFEVEEPLEIRITTDETANTLTIADSGIGMTREELVENLGTIAHSGSKKFMQALSEAGQKESALIGQFGVGFYSAFMVADDVKVYTHSWRTDADHLVWSSDGRTGYDIDEAPGQKRGCRVVVHLREDQKEFAQPHRIKGILESYSSFVPFPILLNGERVNTVEALWRKPKSEITDEQYTEFYKFIGKAWDEPRYRMHFSADAPLEINALLFVPKENTELFGFGQMEPGVSLYCKNVLIDDKPAGLLPEWLRFLRGIIDSADLPLNISRESMQDSALVRKLNRVVAKRFLKFLDGEARSDAEKYRDFYTKFSRFLKEGVATDAENKDAIAKLLRYESSMTEPGELTSLDDYLTRAKDGQDRIFYLIGDNRAAIEAGPYLEAFQARGLEVLYLTEPIDDYVIRSLGRFEEKTLVSADRADLDLGEPTTPAETGEPLPEDRLTGLCDFIAGEIGDLRVEKVEAGNRLVGSPAAALNPDEFLTAQMRRMMQAMNPDEAPPPLKVRLEINPRHDLIRKLDAARDTDPELARLVAAQLFDNALFAAGLLEDKKSIIARGYDLMDRALKSQP